MYDFNVHLASSASPSWTVGTLFNCAVTNYVSGTGVLSFTATANVLGDCKFIVIVRSAEGTGVVVATLLSSQVNVPRYAYVLDSTVLPASSTWTSAPVATGAELEWPIIPSNTAFTVYKPNVEGEYLLASDVNEATVITSPMYRSNGTLFTSSSSNIVNRIKYLLIIENEALHFTSGTTLNAVRWTATIPGTAKTCFVTTTKGSFSSSSTNTATGKYTTNFTYGGSATASDFFTSTSVCVNGASVTIGTATSVGPFTKSKGLRFSTNFGAATGDGTPDGLCGSDYAMHIAFATEVNIKIDGFSNFSGTTDTTTNYLGRGTAGTTTFACYPRFGAFNAYSSGYNTGSGVITDMASFLTATASVCAGLGIPMLETASTLAPRLLASYAMPLDANAAISYYASSGMTVNEGTKISTYTVSYPTAFLKNFMRSQTFSTTNLVPIALYQSRYPWSGYNTISGSANSSLPSGFFVDPSSGLPILGNNVGTPPPVTISYTSSGKKYVSVDASTIAWTIGGIRGTGTPATPYSTAAFGGTLFDITNTGTALMTPALESIKYTAVSWVGCAFHNNMCLAPITGAKQSFIWSGFYCGGSVAAASGLLSTYHATTGGKIVWDLATANGETPAYGVASYVTYAAPPHNVLMWTPLAGTDPTDRETMHMFTMLINNQASITDNASIDTWVQLYQNGVKLERVAAISTNLRATYTSGKNMMNNVILTQVPDSTALNNLFSGNAQAGGAPVANAYAQAVAGTKWAFAENNVQTKQAVYSQADAVALATPLAFKWGIVPMITDNSSGNDIFVLNWVGTGGTNVTGTLTLSRIGFFVSIAEAVTGTNDVSLSAGSVSSFGLATSADWTTVDATGTWPGSRGSFVNTTGAGGNTIEFKCNAGTNSRVASSITAGAFIRLNMAWSPLASVDATGVRMFLRMRHNNVMYSYGLGFSYNNVVYNTAFDAFMDSSGAMLAYKGVYRLVLLTSVASIEWPARNYALTSPYSSFEWSNPYTKMMDSISPSMIYAGVSEQVSTNSSPPSYSNVFLRSLYPTKLVSLKVYGQCAGAYNATGSTLVDRNIPAWSISTNMNLCYSVGTFSGVPISSATQPYWAKWQDSDSSSGHPAPANTNEPCGNVSRALMTFASDMCVRQLIILSGTPGVSTEWPKFEIVASNDGTNFVRLPTRWYDGTKNVSEVTFSLEWRRRRLNNKPFSLISYLAETGYTAADVVPFVFNSVNWTGGNWFAWGDAANTGNSCSPYAPTFIWTIDIENDLAYKYYGLGSVGSDIQYASGGSVDPNRYTARYPMGSHHYSNEVNSTLGSYASRTGATTWGPVNGTAGKLSMQGTTSGYVTAGIKCVQNVRIFMPQVTAATGAALTVYKYWRIRATSAFLGACGSMTKAYFWKLGLYRNQTDATADTLGLSSNNYLQQNANAVQTGVPGALVAASTAAQSLICISTADWNTSQSTAGSAAAVSFTGETACIQFTLDVAGEIGAIRFPDNMYYDANVRGGTFILEAATAGASNVWVPMVATSTTTPGKYLGREGILNSTPVASGAAGNQALGFTVFSITQAGSYAAPQTLANLTGTFNNNVQTIGALITIQAGAGSWTASKNEQLDFSVHMIQKNATQWTPGTTKFNGNVTSYNKTSGVLQFNVTPTVSGTCTLVVFVRDGTTGLLATTLLSADVSVSA